MSIFDELHKTYSPHQPRQKYLSEIEESHQILIAELAKQHRKLVLQIIDNKDMICGEHGRESFRNGFLLAWRILGEMDIIKDGQLFREFSAIDDRFIMSGESA